VKYPPAGYRWRIPGKWLRSPGNEVVPVWSAHSVGAVPGAVVRSLAPRVTPVYP